MFFEYILKVLGSRKNPTTIAEVGLAGISTSDRAQFVREIFSSAISRRNFVLAEYIPIANRFQSNAEES